MGEKSIKQNNKMEIITYKKANHILLSNSVGDNNGLKNQIIPTIINANIESIKFKNSLIVANGETKLKTKNNSFYLSHLYTGFDNKIHCAGYYTKTKDPYKDENLQGSKFSVNICLIENIII